MRQKFAIITNSSDKNVNLLIQQTLHNKNFDEFEVVVFNNINALKFIDDSYNHYWIRKFNYNSSDEDVNFLINEYKNYFDVLISRNKAIRERDNLQNRIYYYEIADKCGIRTPDYIVTNKRKKLLEFKLKNQRIVNKCLGETYKFTNRIYYVREMEIEEISKLPDIFNLMYFEKLIIKNAEIRTVFLNDKFYSMIMFEKRNLTKKYVDNRQNRKVNNFMYMRYNINTKYQKALCKYFKLLGLKYCTLDIILSNENELFLVDINPSGQFSDVEKYCNYEISKEFSSYMFSCMNKKISQNERN